MRRVGAGAAAVFTLLAMAGPAAAQQNNGPSLGECLFGSDSFSRCMEGGPVVSRLLREVRKELADIRAARAKSTAETPFLTYNLRFTESRMIRRLTELFRADTAELPASAATLINEVAVEVARVTKLQPVATFERYWTPATRAEIATLPAAEAREEMPVARPPNDAHVIGQKFVQIYAIDESEQVPPLPVSAVQQADIGRFVTTAAGHLEARDAGAISQLQNQLAEYRTQLHERNEEVSPALDQLDRQLINTILELETAGSAHGKSTVNEFARLP